MTIKEDSNARPKHDEIVEEDIAVVPSAPPEPAYMQTSEPDIPFATAVPIPDSHIEETNKEPPNAQPQSQVSTPAGTTNNSSVVVTQQTPSGTPIPAGARWITVKHIGGVTWSICAIVSTVTCCLTLCPCGVWAFLCPCDEIRAYEVNGQVYDEHGRPLGRVNELRVVSR